ncbi:MAG: hypothetical protein ACLQVG_13500 [Terriglobia bacterium]
MNPSEKGSAQSRPSVDLQPAYEALRRQILTTCSVGRGERELALLMHQGMAAWIGAWRRCGETADDASTHRPTPPVGGTVPLAGLRGEIVRLLTGMVLSVNPRQENPCR